MPSSFFFQHRLTYQESPRQASQISEAPDQAETLASQFAPKLQAAIDHILPSDAKHAENWHRLAEDPYRYGNTEYQVRFINKQERSDQEPAMRRLGIALTSAPNSPSTPVLRDVLSRQIAIYRVTPELSELHQSEDSSTSPSHTYQVLFDPLQLVLEFSPATGFFDATTRGQASSEPDLQKVLEFVETRLPMIVLASRIEGGRQDQ